jgi:hypothetical protein
LIPCAWNRKPEKDEDEAKNKAPDVPEQLEDEEYSFFPTQLAELKASHPRLLTKVLRYSGTLRR